MQSFSLSPEHFGLPSLEKLKQYRIWDSYFLPADGEGMVADVERTLPVIEKGAIEKLCVFLDVGLGTASAAVEKRIRENPKTITTALERFPDRLLGMIKLNANDVPGSMDAIHRWLRDGPMVGVYFPGGRLGALACSHPNFDPLVERITELGGVVMQHTWYKTGGKEFPGESTPADLAALAARHPKARLICAHAGGEWEQGIRAVKDSPNVLVETSGFDPTAGFIEFAVQELGSERVVFGSHLPSRSLGTEFGKIFGAEIGERDRERILGGNFRRLLQRILKK